MIGRTWMKGDDVHTLMAVERAGYWETKLETTKLLETNKLGYQDANGSGVYLTSKAVCFEADSHDMISCIRR